MAKETSMPSAKPATGTAIAWTRCGLLFDQTMALLAEAMRTYESSDSALDAMRLEPRILLSATPIAPIADADTVAPIVEVAPPATPVSAPQSNDSSTARDSNHVELVVIDPRLADSQTLLNDLSQRQQSGVTFEILTLDTNRDGISQINDAIRNQTDISAIHILSHGSDGRFLVGSTVLSNDNLDSYASALASWHQSLSSDADILIYGCDVASSELGQSFITQLAELTGADVAASTDVTGATSLGGNWNLEYSFGQISTGTVINPSSAANWSGLLQAVTVTTTADTVDGNTSSISALLASRGADNFISLREAIIASNNTSGSNTIFLSAGNYVLSRTGTGEDNASTGDLDIRKSVDIYGAATGTTIVDGNSIDRVFSVLNNSTVSINDLTVRGGNIGSGDGGGILVSGSSSALTLSRVTVTANYGQKGAGISVKDGTLTINDSTVSSNTSSDLGGGIYNEKGDVYLKSVAVINNSATSAGGGIYSDGSSASLSLTNVTVSGNSTTGQGGGIYNKPTATIVHSTIAYNSAASGGGVYLKNPGTVTIQNSILSNNTGGNANATLTGSLGHNISDNSTGGLTHATDIVADPKLRALGNYGGTTQTHALLSSSAAIDGGAVTGATQVDQRGFLRDTTPDIGAFEYQRISTTGEAQINATTAGIQETSANTLGSGQSIRGSQQSVSTDAQGNYVVVWQSASQDGSGWGVYTRRVAADGTPLTGDVQVNQYTTGNQDWARVASDAQGNFVVTWTSESQDGSGAGVYARRFQADGTALGNEFRVNTTTTGDQDNSAIAIDPSTGTFVIAWEGQGPGDNNGIFFRRFSSDGTALDATDKLANLTDRGTEQDTAITMLAAGKFAIGWTQSDDTYLQRFNSNGSRLGSEISVDGLLVLSRTPALDADQAGNFIVVYRDASLLTNGIYAKVYNADGTVKISNFQVTSGASAMNPAVSMADDGSFTVVWNESGDSSGQAIKARQYNASGTALATAFRVNTTQSGDQQLPSVAMLDASNFVVVWSGESANDNSGIVARQYGTASSTNIAPVANNDSYTVNRGATISPNAYLNWYDQSWQYRQLLTVPLTSSAVSLDSYPVLVRLHATASDAININYSDFGNAGQDLRFVDPAGNLLSYQIESWNPSGYSQVWVNIPQLETAASHNTFYMYYGNASGTDAQTPTAVWDPNYVGVYHLNGTATDSTSNANNGTSTSVTNNSGIVAQAASFDGANSRINVGSASSIDNVFAGGGTISAWIKPTGWGEGGYGRILDKATDIRGSNGYALQVAGTNSTNGQIIFENGFSSTVGAWRTSPGSVSLNTWQHIVISYDNSSTSNVPTIYINGVQQSLVFSSTPSGTATSDAAQNLMIGNLSSSPARTFLGSIDEVRISHTIRDSNWVAEEYRSVSTAPTTAATRQSRPTGLLVNDTDADDDSLTVTLVSGPAHANAFTLNSDGSFNYQHDGSTTTADSFVYQISDGQGGTSTATANLAIQWTNTPPTISAISNRTISEDTASGAIAFTIGDAESVITDLVVSAASSNQTLIADGDLILSGSGANRQISFTPKANASGSATVTISVFDGLATTTRSFNVTVTAVNDAPTISTIADQTVNEDTASGTIAFTVSDVETAAGSLVVSATSSNQSLVPNANITVGGSGSNRTIAFTPSSNTNGTGTITVTVSDGTTTSTSTFNVTVTPVNDAPTISSIANQTINEDTASTAIAFTISDVETAAGSLVVSATSSNQSLIANANITLGGSGSSRTIAFTPVGNANGSGTITVTVSDGTTTATSTFNVTVTAVNDTPTISAIADQTINEDTSSNAIAFTVSDVETAAGSLVVSATSSNQSLVADADITLGGSGSNRTIAFTPSSNANGSGTITVTVSDGTATATRTFNVTVTAVNDTPTVSAIADQTINEDTPSNTIAFTVGDVETAAGSLVVSATSSNQSLVPNANITLGGSGSNRTISFTSTSNANGSGTITVTISDGTATATRTFNVTVTPVNDAPTISAIADQTINEDTPSNTIAFTVGDVETAVGSLVVTATSSNQSLVADADITLGGSGSNRTIAFTPSSNANGSGTITVTVSDGTTTATQTFNVTVNPVNDTPTISAIADQTVNENTPSASIAFTINDVETAPGSLIVSATSSNQSLIANSDITLGGSGTNRTIAFTPQSNINGWGSITVSVNDGNSIATQTFNVHILPANNSPVISLISDQSFAEDTSSGLIAFTVNDIDTPLNALVISATSSDQSIIADNQVVISGSGSSRNIVITPQVNAHGIASITITVTDGVATSTRSFDSIVGSVNDVPVAAADSINVGVLGTITFTQSSLLANDVDADGDTLVFGLVSGPAGGTLTTLPNGDLEYRQTTPGITSDSFAYRVFDGSIWSDPVVVTLNVDPASLASLAGISQSLGAAQSSTTANQSTSKSTGNSAPKTQQASTNSPASTASADSPNALSNSLLASLTGMTSSSNQSSSNREEILSDMDLATNQLQSALISARSGDEVVVASRAESTIRDESQLANSGRTNNRTSWMIDSTQFDVTRMVIAEPQLWEAIDSMKQDMATSFSTNGAISVGTAATTTAGMTVGYVVWVLRSGLLLSSVMAHLPMWRFMDPLAILDSNDVKNDEDEETIGSIAAGDKSEGVAGEEDENGELEMVKNYEVIVGGK